jgi:hypothetical protein
MNVLPRVPDPHVCEQAPHALQEPAQLVLVLLVLLLVEVGVVVVLLLMQIPPCKMF